MAIGLGAAALIGGGSLLGGIMGGNAAKDAARASIFRPVDVTTGIGTVRATGRPGDVDFETELSPEMQAIRDQLLGAGVAGLDAFQTFDPREAGRLFTAELDALAMPQERNARLAQENRLFKQGLLGATTGANQTEALLTAQALAGNERRLQGMLQGQSQQDRLFQSALGGIQGATALDALLAQQLNQAISAGGAQTMANATGANFQFQAGMNQADAISGFFSNLGQGLMSQSFAPTAASAPAPLFGGGPSFASPEALIANPAVFRA